MKQQLISILIPFYGAENYLLRCLESTAAQTYSNIEVIITNDCSTGKDKNGRTAAEIVKSFTEKYKDKENFTVRYFENKTNIGTFENRRRCIEESLGEYCCFLDDDDVLLTKSISFLYEKAVSTNADIVQGTAKLFYSENTPKERISSTKKATELVHEGVLIKDKIIDNFLCNKGHPFFLWGKLFKTKNVKRALKEIPHFYGILGEDFMLYYFICKYSKKYAGYKEYVYQYSLDTGLTSYQTIHDIDRWKRICTASSVFSILYTYFEKHAPSKTHKAAVQKLCLSHLVYSVKVLHRFVAPEIYDSAYKMLCEYWGKSFVEKAESAYSNAKDSK